MNIQRCKYQADIAQLRFEQVDSAYRLVAAFQEKTWNLKLEKVAAAGKAYQDYSMPSVISRISVFPFLCNYQKKNRCEIPSMKKQENKALAAQIPSLWKETALIKDVEITHLNLNDEPIEGIRVNGKPAFSVQYHPEANPGPHDSRYLFDQFVEMITASPVEMV